MVSHLTNEANNLALERLRDARPHLIGVRPGAEAMGLNTDVILTSGPSMPFAAYTGGQRAAIIGGALYEHPGWTESDVVAAFEAGRLQVRGCQEYDCVGSLAGVTTASMPVLVVEDPNTGAQAFCTLYEGDSADRLNYGSYTKQTVENLEHLRTVVAPSLDKLLALHTGGIDLKPIMARALTMGDELHSRNAAATLLLFREILRGVDDIPAEVLPGLRTLDDDYFFLRVSMAASKLMANSMANIPHSTIITAMAFSCGEFGIQVSGLGKQWFTGPVPEFIDYKIEGGLSLDDMEIMGGESVITETVGLGGMAQAAAFPLMRASGGDVNKMIERTEEMYAITHSQSPEFLIPALNYRGVPQGIDVRAVVDSGVVPYLDIGMAGSDKRQIGGGVARPPLAPFIEAWKALRD